MGLIETRTVPLPGGELVLANFAGSGRDASEQLVQCLGECSRQVGLPNVVRQVFFVSEESVRPRLERAVADAYGAGRPVTTVARQPPVDGKAWAAELWALRGGSVLHRGGHCVAAQTESVRWAFVGGLEIGTGADVLQGLPCLLTRAAGELEDAGVSFGRLVRTWYYIGGILEEAGGETCYDRVNRARNALYARHWPDLRSCPASTGIGMAGRRVALEGFAMRGRGDALRVSWVDNPLQTPPHLYYGEAERKRSPSFSRAAAVRMGDEVLVFVSGTASIRGSVVVCPGDPLGQTCVTLENITTILCAENLRVCAGLPRGATLADVQQYRAYVKRPGDVQVVLECCAREMPGALRTCVLADVCRPECLVEIEAVAAFRV